MNKMFQPQSKTLLFFNLLSLLAFLFFLYAVVTEGEFTKIDLQLSQAIPTFQEKTLTSWVLFITNLNVVIGATIFTVLFSLYLFLKKYYWELKFYLGAFFLSSAVFEAIKLIIERTRPVLKIIDEQGYSFPSGHSTMSMTIALALYLIFSAKIQKASHRRLLLLTAILWPLTIVSARLYLNVHWLSDTLGGVSLGIFCTTLVYLILKKNPKTI